MSGFLKNFGNNIKNYRNSRGYTQEVLAGIIDVATTTLSDWENGKAFIKYSSLVKLCDALQVTEFDLLSGNLNKTGNDFVDEVQDIAFHIPSEKYQQVLKILKTFVG